MRSTSSHKNHRDKVFFGRPLLHTANRLSYNGSTVSFAPYGEYWREMRKIMITELFSAKRVQLFEAVRFEEVKLLLHSVDASSGPVNLSELILSLSNNVVCKIALGKRYGDKGNESKVCEMLRETQELLGGFCVADFFPRLGWLNKFNGLENRLDKNFRELDEFYEQVIEEHIHDHERLHENLVDVLLQIQKDPHRVVAITNDQIKGVLTVEEAYKKSIEIVLNWIQTTVNPRKTQSDASGAMIVYSAINGQSLNMVMSCGGSSFIPVRPSGFAILPNGNNGGGGSLLTIGLQMLQTGHQTAKLSIESVETVNNLMTCTIQKIKDALGVA
ncbi:hypothetical protein RJT34_31419 [Clitoria ternatea]|uniref:HD-Zip IV C-terminal domain-containing protein n=1 Tax=Clitoria ternatea TaxID=43366 RepID=A0AAN9EU88_CLITE